MNTGVDFQPAEVELIPEEWKIVTVKDIGKVVTGSTPSTRKTEYYGNEYMFITPFDLGSTKYIYSSNKKLSKKGFLVSRHIPKDSVLVVCIGSTIGKVGMSVNECTVNQQINAIICNSIADPQYVYYCISFRSSLLKTKSGSAAVPIIKKSLFEQFKIPIPSVEEQKKIAFILSKVDDLIQKTDQIIEQTQRLKKGLMQKLLVKGLHHSNFKKVKFFLNEYEVIPQNWQLLRLGDIVGSYKNGIYKPAQCYGKGVPNIRMFNIKRGVVDALDAPLIEVSNAELQEYSLETGDILLNRVNSVQYVGRAGIIEDVLGKAVFDSMIIRIRVRNEVCDPYYLAYFMNSQLFIKQVRSYVQPSINQASINQEDLSKIRILLPSLEEQQEISRVFDLIKRMMSKDLSYRQTLSILKEGLMQKLLTGKIRVKV